MGWLLLKAYSTGGCCLAACPDIEKLLLQEHHTRSRAESCPWLRISMIYSKTKIQNIRKKLYCPSQKFTLYVTKRWFSISEKISTSENLVLDIPLISKVYPTLISVQNKPICRKQRIYHPYVLVLHIVGIYHVHIWYIPCIYRVWCNKKKNCNCFFCWEQCKFPKIQRAKKVWMYNSAQNSQQAFLFSFCLIEAIFRLIILSF